MKCGRNKFCLGFEPDNKVYCYGANGGCLWGQNTCDNDDDCKKYSTTSQKYTDGVFDCKTGSNDVWYVDACPNPNIASTISIKGVNIINMIDKGTYNPSIEVGSKKSGKGFPKGEIPTVEWEKPKPFGITIENTDLSNFYKAKHNNYTISATSQTIPAGVTQLKVICIGGGGGGSGGNGGYRNSWVERDNKNPGNKIPGNKNPGNKNAGFTNAGYWNGANWVNGNWYNANWNGGWRGSWNNAGWNGGFWNNTNFVNGNWVDGNWNADTWNADTWNAETWNNKVVWSAYTAGNNGAKGNYGSYTSAVFNITNQKTFNVTIGSEGIGGAGGTYKDGGAGNVGGSGTNGGETFFSLSSNETLRASPGTGGIGSANNVNNHLNAISVAPADRPQILFNSGNGGITSTTNSSAGANGHRGYCRVYFIY